MKIPARFTNERARELYAHWYLSGNHKGNAGFDLRSTVKCVIQPHSMDGYIPTGLCVAIPDFCFGAVKGRSGIANRDHVLCFEGTIDPSYRGEIKVALANVSDKPFIIHEGDRIAQLVVIPFQYTEITEVSELDDTDRGVNGFGSTGRV